MKCAPGCTCGRHKFGPDHPRWTGREVSHRRMHKRLEQRRGKADEYPCAAECGRDANEWARIHGEDPFEYDSYIPLCWSCHRRYDSRHQPTGRTPTNALFDNEEVALIRESLSVGLTRSEIANALGVGYHVICNIDKGVTYNAKA